jgi:hypothetical protein
VSTPGIAFVRVDLQAGRYVGRQPGQDCLQLCEHVRIGKVAAVVKLETQVREFSSHEAIVSSRR